MIIIKYRKSIDKNKHSFLKRLKNSGSEKRIKIIETLSLGGQRSIVLIQLENRSLLVGNARRRISLLTSFPGEISPISETDERRLLHDEVIAGRKTRSLKYLFDVRNKRRAADKEHRNQHDIRAKMSLVLEALER